MFRYADPDVCPACRHRIDRTSNACTVCGVDLLGETAARVFQALTLTDRLVASMTTPAPAAPPAPSAPSGRAPMVPPVSLSATSVPKILLGLGALCLLVASVVFLVVAWAALGVGGRTGVLIGFTLVAAALMTWVVRRGLRAGAEAFSVVVLGLLAIDVGGAREAGWLGSIGDPWFLALAGGAVALVGATLARWARATEVSRLLGSEVATVLGVAVVAYGAADGVAGSPAVAALVGTLVCGAGALAARRVALLHVALGCCAEAVLAWLVLVLAAADQLWPPTAAHVWGELAVWPTLAAAAVAGMVTVPRSLPLWSRVTALGAALVVGTLALAVVSFDESATTLTLVQLSVIAACAVAVVVLPSTWCWAAVAPSSIAALALAGSVVSLAGVAGGTVVPDAPWTTGLLEGFAGPDIPWSWPLLLPVGVIGLGVYAASVLRCAGLDPRRVLAPGAALSLAAVVVVPPLYGAPLLAGVAVLVLGAVGLGAAAILARATAAGATATVITGVAVVAGLGNPWTTALALASVLVGAIVAERQRSAVVALLGLVTVPGATAGLLWTAGHLADLPLAWQALPVALVLGLGVVLRPGVDREVASGVAAGAAVAASVGLDGTLDATWLAVYLTIAGVVVTGSSLLHPSRRSLARVGLGFFTVAQWLRLDELGVDVVEAYTLPLALVLLVVGCVSLWRGTGSSVRALGPGLGLALVPTLLLVLDDPVGPRALLLGIACVALVAAGLVAGLSAPLAAGALCGALLVVRQATMAEVLPQWAIIGLVGIGLTVVGITWEQRLQELRRASSYIRGLR